MSYGNTTAANAWWCGGAPFTNTDCMEATQADNKVHQLSFPALAATTAIVIKPFFTRLGNWSKGTSMEYDRHSSGEYKNE